MTLPIEIPVVTLKRAAPFVELSAKDRAIVFSSSCRSPHVRATFSTKRRSNQSLLQNFITRLKRKPSSSNDNPSHVSDNRIFFSNSARLRAQLPFRRDTLYASILRVVQNSSLEMELNIYIYIYFVFASRHSEILFETCGVESGETINAFFGGHDRATMPSYNVQLREGKIFYTISIGAPLTKIRTIFSAETRRDRVMALLVKATCTSSNSMTSSRFFWQTENFWIA